VGLVSEVLEDPRRLLRLSELLLGLVHCPAEHAQQTLVLGQTKHVIDAVGLAPVHQVLATETAVAAQHDRHAGPRLPDATHDADQVLERPRRRVDVRRPQQGQQRMVAAEDIQRQIAVRVVIAVKEAAELMAMQRVVGGIHIQDHARRRHHVLLQEGLHQKGLQGVQVGHNLFVAAGGVGPHRGEFEAVERTLARQRFAAVALAQALAALGIVLGDQHGHEGVMPQLVVVVEIFVAQAQTEDALLDQFGQGVFDEVRVAAICETAGKLFDKTKLGFDLPQQQSARIGGDLAAIKATHHRARTQVLEKQLRLPTLCHSKTAPSLRRNAFDTQTFTSRRAVLFLLSVRNAG
jgi:hypothetical protein